MSPPPIPRPYRLRTLTQAPPRLGDHTLACVVHAAAITADEDPRRIHVPLPVLSGPAVELWETDSAVHCGHEGRIAYAQGAAILFAQLRVDGSAMRDPRRATAAAYAELTAFFARRRGWHWVRSWNYIGDIHRNAERGNGDEERYRQFVLGRHDVLSAEPGFEARLPAATAIGTGGDALLVYVLGARQPGLQIENPRQVSAFRYPRQYGPRSPSFSRARRLDWANGADLIVSGTASVVGHETAHPGDAERQLRETLENLRQLRRDAGADTWGAASTKLFVRDAAIWASVQPTVRSLLPATELCVLEGEICRADLALEIEVLLQR
ncbi:pteridine-dependent deoxygenase [Sinimarinibacterium thermocellulolyticum]|uniref:Pteridine-dependent deoxygenase n=1 Tax=Sinimarinibacterium thermocellulolyticum TaxID=3170016 RepID=A0ABV2AC52_9GAMM